ncbi:MAG: glutamate--cysteine ligase [Desulfobacterales bacterium]|nr:glutamate--cysteine ligase [Desulfobacterales bacterium]
MSFPFHIFDVFGIELEYMIVNKDTLDVLPITDKVIEAESGQISSEIELGDIAWSNELVLHVIELKTNGPVKSLSGLSNKFLSNINRINNILDKMNGCLMPTAMHPWMNPLTETHLWPHEYSPIYEAYNKIFGCKGHGWSNLQSTHINLPFGNDDEFAKLHSGIRLILPIMPALTASSPIIESKITGFLDSRMIAYSNNSAKIPSIAGKIIPERAFSQNEYSSMIFEKMYKDINTFDTEGILQHEFLNSRGAIARFDRGAIEIRVLDIQECPQADIALAGLIISAIASLAAEKWIPLKEQMKWEVDPLSEIFKNVVKNGHNAVINNSEYLNIFGLNSKSITAGELWMHISSLSEPIAGIDDSMEKAKAIILKNGCLAQRILDAHGKDFRKERIKEVYNNLCSCLQNGVSFV